MADNRTWWKYTFAGAGEAWRIAATIAATVPVTDAEDRMKPVQIAKFACDVAAAVAQELEARDWIEFVPIPGKGEPGGG